MSKLIIQVNPVIDYKVRGLCSKQYPDHKKGCPNYNKRPDCPPNAPFFDKVVDMDKPIYVICNLFDLKSHVERMKAKHPQWSNRQLRCLLYWQRTSENQLLVHLKGFLKEHKGYTILKIPEAMGVDVTKTLQNAGVELQWPPEDIAYKVVLAGVLKEPADNPNFVTIL